MKLKAVLFLSPLIFVMFAVFALRPVTIADEKDCLTTSGVVVKISEGGVNDVVFTLAGIDETFYVNRGLERGLNLQALRAELLNKPITIKYPPHWTPLGNSSRHTSKIEYDDRVIFSELH